MTLDFVNELFGGSKLRRRRPARRGVLLLVVLSLLVLFVVIAVTFVLIAGQFRRGARSEVSAERYTNDPQRQLEDAVYQVFRGSDNLQSVIGPHSLLEDMYGNGGGAYDGYGNGGWTGSFSTTTAPAQVAGGQLIDLTVTPNFTTTFIALNQTYGYYNGQVLTMLTGPARGVSTRIVGYQYLGASSAVLRVMAFEGVSTYNANTPSDPTTLIGYSTTNPTLTQDFVINGRAFNGTGFGYNTATARTDARQNANGPFYYALMPNFKFMSPTYGGGAGGGDEDYDAPDFQNMALAYMPVFPSVLPSLNPTAANPATLSSTLVPLPSFHRPDLCAWWAKQPDSTPLTPKYPWTDSSAMAPNTIALNRQVIMRPLGPTVLYDQTGTAQHISTPDHPLFTGSNNNPANPGFFDPVNGPWDVDNDGDGVADSIWLDLGYPVQTSADGKAYKPLFAFLVLDMDGRLNVNAHGNITQTTVTTGTQELYNTNEQGPFAFSGTQPGSGSGTTVDPTSALQNPASPNVAYTSTPIQNSVQLPRGQGYGPADINLGYPGVGAGTVYGNNYLFSNMQYYQALMTGLTGTSTAQSYDGRHGEYSTSFPLPGYTTTATSVDDILSQIKHFEIPQNYFLPATYLTNYGTPPDLWGRGALALDFRGQPVFSIPLPSSPAYGATLNSTTPFDDLERTNNPYTLNQSRSGVRASQMRGAVDNLFTPGELERLLRRFDVDAYALPDRLRGIIDNTNSIPQTRQLVTTDSNDVPSPSILGTTEINSLLMNPTYGATNYTYSTTQTAAGAGNPFTPLNMNISDMLITKLVNSGNYNVSTMGPINQQLQKMLPPELVAGQYMDLNRPFGNGADDNGNNAVDEPQEYATHTEGAWNGLFPGSSGTVPFNLLNYMDFNVTNNATAGSTSDQQQLYARHLFARHLYVLTMLLMDEGYLPNYFPSNSGHPPAAGSEPASTKWGNSHNEFSNGTETVTTAVQQELTARRIAQWAINAVDYRDADSIMTPFEYDVNPFNGWDVDGVIGNNPLTSSTDDTAADRRLVWGCEYPELMITETFATHDRRVRDTKNDNGVNKSRYDANVPPNVTDQTMDQIRIPQGSLFVELYCPRPNTSGSTGTQAVLPGDLYAYNAGTSQWSLNLASMAPADNHGIQNPVWRVVVLASNVQSVNNNVASRMQNNPVTTTLDPPDAPHSGNAYNFSVFSQNFASGLNPSGHSYATIERIIWFSTSGPTNTMDPHYGKVYYNWASTQTSNTALLSPGDYAVVGPRPYTTFGRSLTGNTATQAGTAPATPALSPQAIQITPSVNYISTNGSPAVPYPTVGTNIQQPLGIVCAGPIPRNTTPAWNGTNTAPKGIGVSISEPLYSSSSYYAEPNQPDTAVQNVAAYNGLIDAYGKDGSSPQPFRDLPFEAFQNVTAPNTNYPLVADTNSGTNMLQTQTYLNYKTVVLQRLANPLLAYNPMPNDPNEPNPGSIGGFDSSLPANPYISIDWMPVNLTVFNGEQVPFTNPTNSAQSMDPDDTAFLPGAGTLPPPPLHLVTYPASPTYSASAFASNGVTTTTGTFGTAQRGQTNTTPSTNDLNLWFPGVDAFPNGSGTRGSNNLVFDYNLDSYGHTLGFLNRAFLGNAGAGHPWSTSDTIQAPAAFVGDPNPNFWLPAAGGGSSNNVNRTFPWINWANRPFISHYELMQVPASSPTRLLWEFGFIEQAGTVPSYNDTYDGTSTPSSATVPPMFLTPFPYLLNFNMTAPSPANGGTAGTAPHFYRLFDYARVPSRFVGTETWLSPAVTASQLSDPNNTGITETQLFSFLHPPFNKVSRYRDPGKVNINTIPHLPPNTAPSTVTTLTNGDTNPVIWNAIVNDPAPYTGSATAGLSPGDPTIAGPSWQRVAKSLQGPWTGPGTYPTMFGNPFRSFAGADLTLAPGAAAPRGIDVTLMRHDPVTTTSMLFDFPPPAVVTYANSNSLQNLYQAFNAPDRNAYFRYQNLQRMGNLLTTRSNVYAVWVTVGYFQVQPWTPPATGVPGPDLAHPDGYQLADELGSDSGNVTRHRAFYMFDRTIPVGFQRGVNNNVDRAILLRRYIE